MSGTVWHRQKSSSTLPGLVGPSDQTALQQCDGSGGDLWNSCDNVDEERDVVDYGICPSSMPAASTAHVGDHLSSHDVNVRFVLARPQTMEMAGLLGGLHDSMTSSRDFLVATDRVTDQYAGNHDDNNNNGDDDDDDDD